MPSDLGHDQWLCIEWVYKMSEAGRPREVTCNTLHSMTTDQCFACKRLRGVGAKAIKNGEKVGMLEYIELGEEFWVPTPATPER